MLPIVGQGFAGNFFLEGMVLLLTSHRRRVTLTRQLLRTSRTCGDERERAQANISTTRDTPAFYRTTDDNACNIRRSLAFDNDRKLRRLL